MTEILLLSWYIEICHWLQWILSAKTEIFTMFVEFSTFYSNIKMVIIKIVLLINFYYNDYNKNVKTNHCFKKIFIMDQRIENKMYIFGY